MPTFPRNQKSPGRGCPGLVVAECALLLHPTEQGPGPGEIAKEPARHDDDATRTLDRSASRRRAADPARRRTSRPAPAPRRGRADPECVAADRDAEDAGEDRLHRHHHRSPGRGEPGLRPGLEEERDAVAASAVSRTAAHTPASGGGASDCGAATTIESTATVRQLHHHQPGRVVRRRPLAEPDDVQREGDSAQQRQRLAARRSRTRAARAVPRPTVARTTASQVTAFTRRCSSTAAHSGVNTTNSPVMKPETDAGVCCRPTRLRDVAGAQGQTEQGPVATAARIEAADRAGPDRRSSPARRWRTARPGSPSPASARPRPSR